MIYMNKYTVYPTTTFKKELEDVIYYIKYRLNEPRTADNFYKIVTKQINTLSFMPERYMKVDDYKNTNKNLRMLRVYKYVVIYEVDNNCRTSLYSTYFP